MDANDRKEPAMYVNQTVEQWIANRALELCPAWQRPNKELEAWAVAQAKVEADRRSCDFGTSCEETVQVFRVAPFETRPMCARHAQLAEELDNYAKRRQ